MIEMTALTRKYGSVPAADDLTRTAGNIAAIMLALAFVLLQRRDA